MFSLIRSRSTPSSARMFAVCLGMLLSGAAVAVPIVVDSANDNLIAGDGACTLREAIDNANWDADLTGGDCEPGLPGMDTIQIQAGLPAIVLGGSELEVRRTMAIIGPPGGQAIDANQLSRVLHVRMDLDSAGTQHYRFERLHLANGRTALFSDSGDIHNCHGRGAGLCAASPAVNVTHDIVLRDMAFEDHRTTLLNGDGGALYASVESISVENSRFLGNSSGMGSGGAIAFFGPGSGAARLSNLRIAGNRADLAEGGGMAIEGFHSVELDRATLSNNIARNNHPMALSLRQVDFAHISNSRIEANLNLGSNGNTITHEGYAVRALKEGSATPVLLVSNTVIDQNLGCGLGAIGVAAFISQSTISRQSCAHDGAALRVSDADVDATASSFIDNTSPFAAVSLDGGSLTLQSTTIVGNQATSLGEAGGVRLDDGTLILRSTILAENAGSEGSFERVGALARIDASTSQFGDASAEINGTNSGNLFQGGANVGPFDAYGCSVKAGDTVLGPAACVPLRPLSSNSPALDQGQAHGAAYDQRGAGFTRVEGNAADIGAHEYQAPLISIEAVDASKVEGNSGTTAFPFRVLRNGDTRAESWAAWNIQGHGASPADSGDFPPGTWIGGTAYFAVGATEATVNVFVNGDTTAESTEGFQVSLAALTNGTMGSASSASGEIINDDAFFPSAVLTLTRLDGDLHEGQYFSSTHRFRVTRSQVTTGTCSFQLEVLAGSGPFAPDAADFVGWTPGVAASYVMMPGNTQWDIEVEVAGDSSLEFDETFELRLQNAGGCGIDTSANLVSSTIFNDDSSLWIEAVTASAPEGNSGSTAFSMLIQRGSSDLHPATVTWTVAGTGANPASAADFSGGIFPSGTVTFAAGQSEMLIAINVGGDTSNEPDESFRVTLSDPSGGDIYPTEYVDATIVNDDSTGADEIFRNSFD